MRNKYILNIFCKQRLFYSSVPSIMKFRRQQDLQVDSQKWNIHDIATVSSTVMLACDLSQCRVNLVDSTAGGVVASVSVPGKPRAICLINERMAAVPLSGKKVQFIRLGRGSLTLDRVLEVSKGLYGITTLENSLITSSIDPPCVEMMSMDGEVKYTVDNQKARREVFKKPYFMTSSRDGFIYVTDCGTNTVTKLDSRLNMLGTYTDSCLQIIYGIISISRDQLLVCSRDNLSIVLLNTRTGNTTVLLGEQDGLKKPCALTYCHSQRKLFVAPFDKATQMQVFKLV